MFCRNPALLRCSSRFILRAMSDGYSTWLEIDLEAIRNNIRLLHRLTQTPVMAIVKANGYGHGAVETARAAIEAGAEWCGVARFEEAIALRKAGRACDGWVSSPRKRCPWWRNFPVSRASWWKGFAPIFQKRMKPTAPSP